MNAIEAKKLTVKKDSTEILHGLDLIVKPGTLTGLIGPSGSGKTTLMRSIVGVQKYEGSLTVLDKPAGDKRLRPKIGYVTQNAAVYSDLTVEQNLQYFASVAGASRQRADEVIEMVELGKQSGHIVASLSGGQRARVSLAVALLGDPELLVLDEPTVGLDPILRQKLWQLFGNLAASGKTLLISSHVMDEADRCDDLVLVRDGRVVWNDTREVLLLQTKTENVGDAFVAMIGDKE